MYHVWQRKDGYVAASNSQRPWSEHSELTLIKTFDDWEPAKALIEKLRDNDEHRALVASWSERNNSG